MLYSYAHEAGDRPTAELVAHVIERQVSHLTRLVDDLLDVARITRGKIKLSRSRSKLGGVIALSVETVQPFDPGARTSVTSEIPDGTLRVDADPLRLTQAFGKRPGQPRQVHRAGRAHPV